MASLKFAASSLQSAAAKGEAQITLPAAAKVRLQQASAHGSQRSGGDVSWGPSSHVLWISSPFPKLCAGDRS
jgi:hypothetical protein